jgi:hypothetical protein
MRRTSWMMAIVVSGSLAVGPAAMAGRFAQLRSDIKVGLRMLGLRKSKPVKSPQQLQREQQSSKLFDALRSRNYSPYGTTHLERLQELYGVSASGELTRKPIPASNLTSAGYKGEDAATASMNANRDARAAFLRMSVRQIEWRMGTMSGEDMSAGNAADAARLERIADYARQAGVIDKNGKILRNGQPTVYSAPYAIKDLTSTLAGLDKGLEGIETALGEGPATR